MLQCHCVYTAFVLLQVEAHPYWPNDALVSWCASHDVHVTAYSPLGSPDSATMLKRDDTKRLLQDPQLLSIAAKYDKSPAQVGFRLLHTHGDAAHA